MAAKYQPSISRLPQVSSIFAGRPTNISQWLAVPSLFPSLIVQCKPLQPCGTTWSTQQLIAHVSDLVNYFM
jgi:hypothetical protein